MEQIALLALKKHLSSLFFCAIVSLSLSDCFKEQIPFFMTFKGLLFVCTFSIFSDDFPFSSCFAAALEPEGFDFRIKSNKPSSVKNGSLNRNTEQEAKSEEYVM
jgi:hypothetical protein